MPQLESAPSSKKRKHASKPSNATKTTSSSNLSATDKGKMKDLGGSEFRIVRTTLHASISPRFANNPRDGVEELLDSMIMRYIPALEGVVLSHSNLTFARDTGLIKWDCPFLICDISFDVVLWSPRIGMQLSGKISLCSPDHISLLVHRTFNVSIPKRHIPLDDWEFEYGPAENDPEYGAAKPEETKEGGDVQESVVKVAHAGRWTHKLTGDDIGGKSGTMTFTVVGLTIANEMLSLVGSILPDPLSNVMEPTPKKQPREQSEDEGELSEVDRMAKVPKKGEGIRPASMSDSEEEERVVEALTPSKSKVKLKRAKPEQEGGVDKKRKKKRITE